MNTGLLRNVAIAGAIGFGIAIGTAGAQPPAPEEHRGPHGGMMLERADQNGDGLISYDEAIASLPGMTEDRFKHMDLNADGAIGKDEARPRAGEEGPGPDAEALGRRFEAVDTDKDGKLNATELQSFAPRFTADRFALIDANNDGGVTPEELIQGRERVRMTGMGPGGDHGRPRIDLMEHLDADKSGEVSLTELQTVRPEISEDRFARIDTDSSGGVTHDELRSSMALRGPDMPDRGEFLERLFAERDANKDGAVDFDEYKAARPRITPERFAEMDTDSSGSVSKEEFESGFGRRFANPDGSGEHRHPVEAPKN